MTPNEFNQRRAWLEDLLSLPHLWPHQVMQVQGLAAELGVKVRIYDRVIDWNYAINPWQERKGAGDAE